VAYGCTNISACNYSPLAGADDGSCIYPGTPCDDGNPNSQNDTYQANCECAGLVGLMGCTNPNACNYNSLAVIDNGTCIIPESSYCTDNNILTVNDYYDQNCQCVGFSEGSDFTIGGGVTDIDGNQYSTVIINGVEWMAENLKVTHYRNGNIIGYNIFGTEWNSTGWGAYNYFGKPQYGKVYNSHAVYDQRGLCPTNWHVSTYEEWGNLGTYLGNTNKLLYVRPNYGAPVTSGMSVLLAPVYDGSWSSTENNWTAFNVVSDVTWHYAAVGAGASGNLNLQNCCAGQFGLYIRCVKD
jgi:uncharacterized protein (TIGR02145 family)